MTYKRSQQIVGVTIDVHSHEIQGVLVYPHFPVQLNDLVIPLYKGSTNQERLCNFNSLEFPLRCVDPRMMSYDYNRKVGLMTRQQREIHTQMYVPVKSTGPCWPEVEGRNDLSPCLAYFVSIWCALCTPQYWAICIKPGQGAFVFILFIYNIYNRKKIPWIFEAKIAIECN